MSPPTKKTPKNDQPPTPRKVRIEESRRCMVATNVDGSVVPLMSAREISDYLNISKRTLLRYARGGQIPIVRIGNVLRFDVLAVRAALDRTS